MKKIIAILVFATIAATHVDAQKYFDKTGEISFYSHTPIEDIEAISNSASTVYDSESGKIQWAVLIKSFEFEKALMQEHFNENYMESSKYPKAIFKGKINNHSGIDLQTDGTYTEDVQGDLTIHGVTNTVTAKATFTVENGKINAVSSLKVEVADYNIKIPSVVSGNIAKEIEIKINAEYAILDKK